MQTISPDFPGDSGSMPSHIRSHRILGLSKISTVLSLMTQSPSPPSRRMRGDLTILHRVKSDSVVLATDGWSIKRNGSESLAKFGSTAVGQCHPMQHPGQGCVSIWINGCIQTDIKISVSDLWKSMTHGLFLHHFSKITNSSKDLSPYRFNSCR